MYRAGLIAAPVTGPTMMMTANTIEPMASPAQPAGARRSIAPKITSTSRNVPISSANTARPTLTSAAYEVTPRPALLPPAPRVAQIATAPRIAPTTCAARSPGAERRGILRPGPSATATAGLRCAPDTCPSAYTTPTITSMNANEMTPSWAIENGTPDAWAITPVAAAEP